MFRYRTHQATTLLSALADTQPRVPTGASGRSMEDVALKMCNDMLHKLPAFYVEVSVALGVVGV